MVSSNDVKITVRDDGESGLTVYRFESPTFAYETALDVGQQAALESYFRARFAAERMPEDVRALLINADEYLADHRVSESWRFILALRNALEAAYSQKGADDDPR